ncbi:hypothetical protein R3W88_026973 [Solanum pinnatisectum]|uniref:Alliinase C-terminal domain-containing protein n=1 Tax=Solanum pinnatisectum TaxID=50273 RepID=A0AAV9LEV0_9SOLN|nr:hypothetical protein R3W88_026973 [Solanum pinnatisectum]
MTKFMEVSTIGVSKEAQLRAAMILEVISDSCLDPKMENFFEYSQSLMTDRWKRLRQVVMANDLFVLQKYPLQYCIFTKDFYESRPGNYKRLQCHIFFLVYLERKNITSFEFEIRIVF